MTKEFWFIKSDVARLVLSLVVLSIVASADAQSKRALIVGISDYMQVSQDSWSSIHGANDAELIASVLEKQGFCCTKICNKKATAKRIRKELGALAASCKPGDEVYLHFSCHGQPFEDMNGDEEDGWDEAIVPYDALMTFQQGVYEGESHLTDDELHDYFQKIRSAVGSNGYLWVVIDACHAGNTYMGDEEEEDVVFCRGTKKGFSSQGKSFHPRINASGQFQIPQQQGLADIVILEACRSYQSNYEINQDGTYYGPLSYYISQVLAKQNLSKDIGWVLEVKNKMAADGRLSRQNMVYETSIK